MALIVPGLQMENVERRRGCFNSDDDEGLIEGDKTAAMGSSVEKCQVAEGFSCGEGSEMSAEGFGRDMGAAVPAGVALNQVSLWQLLMMRAIVNDLE